MPVDTVDTDAIAPLPALDVDEVMSTFTMSSLSSPLKYYTNIKA